MYFHLWKILIANEKNLLYEMSKLQYKIIIVRSAQNRKKCARV